MKHRSHAEEWGKNSDLAVLEHSAKAKQEIEDRELPALLEWPSRLLEMMMSWHRMSPMELWIETKRFGSKSVPLKTETRETDEEYLYIVDLPDIARDQIALNFQHGCIMLRVETADDQRSKHYHSHHSRSIRRAFSLPVYTDARAITAEFDDGKLTIAIPKTEHPVSPKARTIDIT